MPSDDRMARIEARSSAKERWQREPSIVVVLLQFAPERTRACCVPSHTSKAVPDPLPFEVDQSCFQPLERERGGREGGRERDREGEREREKGRCVVKVIGVESKQYRDITANK